MKNKCERQNEMRKQFERMRKQGKKFVIWKLNPTQKQDAEEIARKVEPYIVRIKTRIFYNIKNIKSSLLKDIHFAKMKKNQHYLIRPLKQREIELLDKYDVKYEVLKYKIFL